jgi:hypothetical protein
MNQHKPETPMGTLAFVFLLMSFEKLPNVLAILVGGVILYVK